MEKLSGFDFWRSTLQSCKHVVAPMVDQSELAWRMLSRRYGAQLCYTPMYHASVFSRDPQYRRDALQSCPEDRPLIIQFCANDPDTLLTAAKLAEDHCDAIDLNLGCPQMIAKRGHYGAFLQDEWELLEKMVSTCHTHLKVPITCKIRVFESIEKTVQYAQMLERAGCQLLTVHGRMKEQKGRLTGLADWKYVKAIKENVKIPVFSNGNIQYLSDVDQCMEETGVDGIMTAEGNLHNPALFQGINPPVWQMAEEYLDLVEQFPCPLSYSRGHIFKLLHHALHLHHDVRDMVGIGNSLQSLREATLVLKERCLEEMKREDFDPKQGLFDELPLPYWYCQPYVRPSADEAKKNKEKRDILKRPLEISELMKENQDMSKKKIKKRLRNPNKNFDKNNKVVYVICVNAQCSNPRGLKCNFSLCKICCRKKTSAEVVDCIGHCSKLKARQAKAASAGVSSSVPNSVSASVPESRQSQSDLNSPPQSVTDSCSGSAVASDSQEQVQCSTSKPCDSVHVQQGDTVEEGLSCMTREEGTCTSTGISGVVTADDDKTLQDTAINNTCAVVGSSATEPVDVGS